ncbi:hypothetical protein THJ007_05350 [Campylobacter jejuni]|nr:hypothetical protein THJ007_05350 [Campylobacter jejuni]GKY62667.1 hypothetical protein THJ090_01820 [Campylobacter jejuni]
MPKPKCIEICTADPMAIISAKAKDIMIKGIIKASAAKASLPRYFINYIIKRNKSHAYNIWHGTFYKKPKRA